LIHYKQARLKNIPLWLTADTYTHCNAAMLLLLLLLLGLLLGLLLLLLLLPLLTFPATTAQACVATTPGCFSPLANSPSRLRPVAASHLSTSAPSSTFTATCSSSSSSSSRFRNG
jgi:hypothetical protein